MDSDGIGGSGIRGFLFAENHPQVARTAARDTWLHDLASAFGFAAKGCTYDPSQVRRHHLDKATLILRERMCGGRVSGEDTDDAIAVHQRCAERASELDATIVQIERRIRIGDRLPAGGHPPAQSLAHPHGRTTHGGRMLAGRMLRHQTA